MRLNNLNSQKSLGDPEGPNAGIMENLLNTSEKKRSRPTSSLDIKVENGSSMTTPPSKSGTKKPKKVQQQQQQQQQQQPRKTVTRARRGRLPSHRRYDDDEDLLQALYEDPEVMAAAAAQKSKKADESGRQYSKKSKSVDEYPDHLKSMMEEGIPVTQWIIVLVLLGAGFYQLRKSLVGSSTGSATAKAGTRATAKTGTRKVTEKGVGRKNGKQKAKKNLVKQKGKARDNRSRSPVPVENKRAVASLPIEDVLASEQEGTTAIKSKPASKKKSRKQRAGKKTAAVGVSIDNEAGSHESPDSVSTDGSSSTEIVPQTEEDREIMANLTEETQLSEEEMRVDSEVWQAMKVSDEDGWQTVGGGDKNRKKSESKMAQKSTLVESSSGAAPEESTSDHVVPGEEKAENTVEDDVKPANLDKIEAPQETGEQAVEAPQETGEQAEPGVEKAISLSKEAETVHITVQPDSADSGDVKEPVKKDKKKKNKKKKSSVVSKPAEQEAAAKQDGRDDTDDDEAFALKLQQEENNFALTTPPPEAAPVEEVWEEVSKAKKKKKNSQVLEE